MSQTTFSQTPSDRARIPPGLPGFYAKHREIILICTAAFVLRLAYRLITGSDVFWSNGYHFFYTVAQNLVAGHGLGLDQMSAPTVRVPPAYPLLLVPLVLHHGNYLYVVLPQAIISTGTVLCAYLIGRELFGERAGLIGAALTTVYPYYVVHDTALQETGLLTFCLALAVWLLLAAARASATPWLWLIAGGVLGLSMMVRVTAAPFALCAVFWIWLFAEGSPARRVLRALTILACVALVAGSWMASNARVIGRPVMSGGSGYSFWAAHNPQTFSHYPVESMDGSVSAAFAAFTPVDWENLKSIKGNGARDDWFLDRGRVYLAHQYMSEILIEAIRKVAAGFSWEMSPRKPGITQWVYFFSYTPILLLGVTGMLRAWRGWRSHSLIYIQFLVFIAISAMMWAHTSYRTPLDVYLIVFAAAALDGSGRRLSSRGQVQTV